MDLKNNENVIENCHSQREYSMCVHCMEMGDLLFQYIMHELWQYFSVKLFFSVKCFLSVYLLPIRFDLSIVLHIGDIRFVFLALYDIVRINHNLIEPNDENKIHDKEKHTETETKRNEMYTWLLLIQYHSDHNLWKFAFFLICLLFGQCRKQKNKWKLPCVFLLPMCYCCHCRRQQ